MDEEENDQDMLAVSLRDSGIIALVKYSGLIDDFEIQGKIKIDLEPGRNLAPFNKLFCYKNQLLFGFAQCGKMRLWDIKNIENIKEITLDVKLAQQILVEPHFKGFKVINQESFSSKDSKEDKKGGHAKKIFNGLKGIMENITFGFLKKVSRNSLSESVSPDKSEEQTYDDQMELESDSQSTPSESQSTLNESKKDEPLKESDLSQKEPQDNPHPQVKILHDKKEELELDEYLAFNTAISFHVLPKQSTFPQQVSTYQENENEVVHNVFDKELIQITIDKSQGKFNLSLINLFIDPDSLSIIDINEVPYKEIKEINNESSGESLKDIQHFLSRRLNYAFRPCAFNNLSSHLVSCK